MIAARSIHRNASRRASVQIQRNNQNLLADAAASAEGISPRRRGGCAVADNKTCALIQTRVKLGELV